MSLISAGSISLDSTFNDLPLSAPHSACQWQYACPESSLQSPCKNVLRVVKITYKIYMQKIKVQAKRFRKKKRAGEKPDRNFYFVSGLSV